jgi:prepilin-type N-terminal cleavage/methylation domain-containing protein
MNIKYSQGISLIEVVIVIAIVVIIASFAVPALSGFRNQQALRNITEDVVSLLRQARSDTIGSLNATNYGVYIEADRATYFPGAVFSADNPANKIVVFNRTVSTGTVSLQGGGRTIIFDRPTGDTATYGTIVLKSTTNPAQQKTITITNTGIAGSN